MRYFLAVILKLRLFVPFSQFLTNNSQLLPQIIFLLITVNICVSLLLNITLQTKHLNLTMEQPNRLLHTANWVQLAQQLCFVLIVHTGVLRNGICDKANIVGRHHAQLHRLRRLFRQFAINAIKHICFPAQCVISRAIGSSCFRNGLHQSGQIRLNLFHFCNSCTAQTGNQHTQVFVLSLKYLLDLDHRTHGIQSTQLGSILGQVFLRHQKQMLIPLHSDFQRL